MILLGALTNGLAIILGGSFGLIFKRGLSEKITNALMNALALCALYVGMEGLLSGDNMLIIILSMVLGTLIGEGLDLDLKVNQFGNKLETRFIQNEKGDSPSIAQGFISTSLIVCIGSMAIVGALQSGITGNHDILFAKAIIDGIISIVLASTLGLGVPLAGILVVVYEGGMALFASSLTPLLTESVIQNLTSVGSLLILGLAFNLLKITDLKVINYSPAIFMPILFGLFI
ncbi:DUF554 domain-containing protein [Jeotgalibaca dankookensis]|uniref:DUF554 domain-containing protein n=1 Tax=Jeotgalibaca dankookensis TaxID=708126 RepID=UPI0007858D36|nr:DUF554 domain-containing protein [Jeotgalibaca dankookensis]